MEPAMTMATARILPLGLLGVLALAACDKRDPPVPVPATPPSASVAAPPKPIGPRASVIHPDLLDTSKATAKAPAVFKASFATTKGQFVIEVHRDWAPLGADRFYNLVKMGFYDDTRFFRVVDGFMAQFGISGDPAVSSQWMNAPIKDDPVVQSNKRGYVSFGQTNSPNSRSTQVFVNLVNNAKLDAANFAPFGLVTTGIEVVDALYNGYGEGEPAGKGPNQSLITARGNAYVDKGYPQLDAINHAEILP
jgi:peptidyl-prolyl cis-trans isomerase A (cyclophilin A)